MSICRLLTCELFLVIRHTGILSCSEIKILFSKINHAIITTLFQVQPDNHCMRTQREAQRADAKAGKGAGGEDPACKWGKSGAKQETCSTRFRRFCSEIIGTLLMKTGLKGLRIRRENSSPPNQNKATER